MFYSTKKKFIGLWSEHKSRTLRVGLWTISYFSTPKICPQWAPIIVHTIFFKFFRNAKMWPEQFFLLTLCAKVHLCNQRIPGQGVRPKLITIAFLLFAYHSHHHCGVIVISRPRFTLYPKALLHLNALPAKIGYPFSALNVSSSSTLFSLYFLGCEFRTTGFSGYFYVYINIYIL